MIDDILSWFFKRDAFFNILYNYKTNKILQSNLISYFIKKENEKAFTAVLIIFFLNEISFILFDNPIQY